MVYLKSGLIFRGVLYLGGLIFGGVIWNSVNVSILMSLYSGGGLIVGGLGYKNL